jgi:lysophospholipase L1-like esterase
VVCALFLLAAPSEGAARKKTRRRAAAPQVSAATRAASLKKVTQYLEGSALAAFGQPGALVPVFELLYRLSSGESRAPVHILHFGDSHTAADEWTGALRGLLQQRFGDGGSGFSLAGRPFPGYRRTDARGGGTAGWRAAGLRTGAGDGYFGLGGVSISTGRALQSVFISAECDRLEVHYLQQPGGGTLALYDYDQRLDEFSTAGELGPGLVRYPASPGAHRFMLMTLEAKPVRLFGWVADKETGVTYEALGINGAEAALMFRWDETMVATYLQRRNPGLIVLAYGTNEASDPNWKPESYRAMFSALLQRLRREAPTASILVIGPPDRWSRQRGKWQPVAGEDGIVAAQQGASLENGCAFWDTRERMGGKGAMRDWVFSGLAQGDRVHFTAAGYQRLASVLFEDFIGQYEAYKKVRAEPLAGRLGASGAGALLDHERQHGQSCVTGELSDQVSHGQANPDR